ncbi:hypothetical protein AVEN_64051-1 [Araneus ventricosus]|uniref:Uncharacterized protein n=1 Tax=Araneus ventricosus TaxID=182803 RepID=A0A4Y2IUU6_ARAVE|nr:hypothetical protein AVEN_64051-1 [Araneus ventricosus]
MLHENRSRSSHGSRSSSTFQSKHTYAHNIELHKYNPATVDIRDITCWRSGEKGHDSFRCNRLLNQAHQYLLQEIYHDFLRIQIINQTLLFRILETQSVTVISHQEATQVQNIQCPMTVVIAPQQQGQWPQERMNLLL